MDFRVTRKRKVIKAGRIRRAQQRGGKGELERTKVPVKKGEERNRGRRLGEGRIR